MKTSSERRSFQRIFATAAGAIIVSVLAVPASYAQVSKCVDKSGKVVGYGSDCPPGTRTESMNIHTSPASSSASGGKSLAERDAEFRKRQIEKQEAQSKAETQAADKEARARACDTARSYLKTLQSGMRIARADPNTGERVYLGDADYPKEIATAQRAVETNCR